MTAGQSTAPFTFFLLVVPDGKPGRLTVLAMGRARVYMTAFDGWAYDRWRGAGMLNAEAGISIVFVALALATLWRIRAGTPPCRI